MSETTREPSYDSASTHASDALVHGEPDAPRSPVPLPVLPAVSHPSRSAELGSNSGDSDPLRRLVKSPRTPTSASREPRQPIASPDATIRRYPIAIPGGDARAIAAQHNESYGRKADLFLGLANHDPEADAELGQPGPPVAADDLGPDYFTPDDIAEISAGVWQLTAANPADMDANCIGWARGAVNQNVPPENIYRWRQDGYTVVTDDDGIADSTILLWGTKDGAEDTWKVLHGSVLLTHAQLAARSQAWGGFGDGFTAAELALAEIPNRCWTSVGGGGTGAIVHPREWYEGGEFGTLIGGTDPK
jgi:hypothetical protein